MVETPETARYRRPGFVTRRIMNPIVAAATRSGLSVWGSRVLQVPGRRSGKPRRTPVNLLEHDGDHFLVAARGHTEWVRNLRASRSGELLLGRRTQPFTAVEVPDADKADVLRAYLRRWKAEVGAFFDGVDASSSDEQLAAIAADHPVFRLTLADT